MKTFLQTVAMAYADRYSDLSEFCFVFPNKRAGSFFLKRLTDLACSKPILAPRVTTISDLAEELSGRIVDNRIDLLFILYKSYCSLLGATDGHPMIDFDDFRSWGETVLNDFNEIDMYCVNPEEIFKNLKDFREIASNYLTEEQKKVLEEYFDYQPGVEDSAKTFWKTFTPDTELKSKFLHLWQTMAPLYHAFEKALEARQLTTAAGSYRLALEYLESDDAELPWKKIIFVGFNALSLLERKLLGAFCTFEEYDGPDGPEPFADFFWDGTGPMLSVGTEANGPAKFLNFNRRDFPSPQWAESVIALSDTNSMPESIRVIASPSNALQAKIVGEELTRLKNTVVKEEFDEARIAVVLPDENMLLPLLYSLPEGFTEVNLTMGYPLRLTATSSFVALYRMLHAHCASIRGIPVYYHKNIRRFLGHPFVHAYCGSSQVAALNAWLNKTHRINVTLTDIAEIAPGVAELTRPLPPKATPREAAVNIIQTLRKVSGSLGADTGMTVIKSRLDRDHINIYIDAIGRLLSAVEEHDIRMSASSFHTLADRMLAAEQVNFEGKPLRGLQVMGMLETRALDFDRIIIPSANERKLPVKGRTKSFLPNSLRAAYHMPPMQHQENLASYYFYRLLSRAREVVILYDARSDKGMGSEPSRYIMQLEHLVAPGRISREEYSFTLNARRKVIEEIPKNDHTMQILQNYLAEENGKELSASSLKTYCDCGLKFFYERVMGIRTDSEPSEYIDAINQGNVVHDVMMNLYLPADKQKKLLDKPVLVDKSYIENLKKERKFIYSLVRRSINRYHFNLPEEERGRELPHTSDMIARNLVWWIQNILERDMEFAPMEIYGCEFGNILRYPAGDSLTTNMNFIIDRLDRPAGSEKYRIVDYKTSFLSQYDFNALEPSRMFEEADSHGYSRQLLIYGELLDFDLLQRGKTPVEVEYAIYNVPKIKNKTHGVITFRNTEGELLSDLPQTTADFRSALKHTLLELFDPRKPFKATANPENACEYCQLKILCGR